MATVIRREESRFWIACFTDRNGRQLKRSTKTTDKNQALRVAVELEQVERQARAGSLTTAQLRKVLSDVSEKVNGDSLNVASVTDHLSGWLEGVKARSAAGTSPRRRLGPPKPVRNRFLNLRKTSAPFRMMRNRNEGKSQIRMNSLN